MRNKVKVIFAFNYFWIIALFLIGHKSSQSIIIPFPQDDNNQMLDKIFETLAENYDSNQKNELEKKIKENLLDRLKTMHFSLMKLRFFILFF